jgi:hypothetical protein
MFPCGNAGDIVMISMPKVWRGILLLTFTLGAAHARAQGLSSSQGGGNPLLAMCGGMLAEGAAGVSGDKNRLCTCLVRDTSAKLTHEEMMAYAEASTNSQAPPPAVMNKVMAIATACLQEAQTPVRTR